MKIKKSIIWIGLRMQVFRGYTITYINIGYNTQATSIIREFVYKSEDPNLETFTLRLRRSSDLFSFVFDNRSLFKMVYEESFMVSFVSHRLRSESELKAERDRFGSKGN